jgi:hypothetical protein
MTGMRSFTLFLVALAWDSKGYSDEAVDENAWHGKALLGEALI